jgi:hypothetical protein
VVGAAHDGEVVCLAGRPGGDGLALWSVEEGEIAFAGKVGAVGTEGRGHAVVDVVAGVGVRFGL